MTLPSEKAKSIKRTRDFLREIAAGPRMPTKLMRERANSCLKHYPWDIDIDKKWADEVCTKCGTDIEWCKCKEVV